MSLIVVHREFDLTVEVAIAWKREKKVTSK